MRNVFHSGNEIQERLFAGDARPRRNEGVKKSGPAGPLFFTETRKDRIGARPQTRSVSPPREDVKSMVLSSLFNLVIPRSLLRGR